MRIQTIHRFPVKGFPTESLTRARVRAGSGIHGDRLLAFPNGSTPVSDGEWNHCLSFTALKTDTSLQQWSVATDGAEDPAHITLTAPSGARVDIDPDDPASLEGASAVLRGLLAARGGEPRHLVRAGQGMFDGRLSGLSLINPATVAALAEYAGRDLDPLRFRGNLLVEGLPAFAEYGLIGAVLRIGTAVVGVRKSSERCPATKVDPTTAAVDANVPRLLATGFGHVHMGIDAFVLVSGTFSVGDPIEVLHTPEERAWEPSGARGGTFDVQHRSSPRFAVVETVQVSGSGAEAVAEVRLRDSLGWIGTLWEPGQHARLHLAPGLWRAFTITGVDRATGTFTVLVRLQGPGSEAVHALVPGTRLLVSGPFGAVTAAGLDGAAHLGLVTAGIGATAALGVLAEGLPDSVRTVTLVHVERAQDPSSVAVRLQERLTGQSETGVRTRFVRVSTAAGSRPGPEALLTEALDGTPDGAVAPEDTAVLLCGPVPLTEALVRSARTAGVHEDRILREVFSSPGGDTESLVAALPPARVTVRGAVTRKDRVTRQDEPAGASADFTWTPEEGTLLEALEDRGVDVPNSCRAGSCGKCAVRLAAGRVLYPLEPIAARGPDEVLLCSAVPETDLALEV